MRRLVAVVWIAVDCVMALPAAAVASSAPQVGAISAEVGETTATLSAPIKA